MNAISGTIAGWSLDGTSLQSTISGTITIDSGAAAIGATPARPATISVGPTSGDHIRITPSGIATYNSSGTTTGKFNLSTNGSLSLSGTITASDLYLGNNTSSIQYLKADGSFHLGGTGTYIEGNSSNVITIHLTSGVGGIDLTSLGYNDDDTAGDPTLVKARSDGKLTLGRTFYYGGNNYPEGRTTWNDAYGVAVNPGDIWLSRKA